MTDMDGTKKAVLVQEMFHGKRENGLIAKRDFIHWSYFGAQLFSLSQRERCFG